MKRIDQVIYEGFPRSEWELIMFGLQVAVGALHGSPETTQKLKYIISKLYDKGYGHDTTEKTTEQCGYGTP